MTSPYQTTCGATPHSNPAIKKFLLRKSPLVILIFLSLVGSHYSFGHGSRRNVRIDTTQTLTAAERQTAIKKLIHSLQQDMPSFVRMVVAGDGRTELQWDFDKTMLSEKRGLKIARVEGECNLVLTAATDGKDLLLPFENLDGFSDINFCDTCFSAGLINRKEHKIQLNDKGAVTEFANITLQATTPDRSSKLLRTLNRLIDTCQAPHAAPETSGQPDNQSTPTDPESTKDHFRRIRRLGMTLTTIGPEQDPELNLLFNEFKRNLRQGQIDFVDLKSFPNEKVDSVLDLNIESSLSSGNRTIRIKTVLKQFGPGSTDSGTLRPVWDGPVASFTTEAVFPVIPFSTRATIKTKACEFAVAYHELHERRTVTCINEDPVGLRLH